MDIGINEIKQMIYVVRDYRVMLDSDLAKLYGVETKRLNEQVKRNLERFPDDFMFQLTPAEYEVMKSQFATSLSGPGGKVKYPFVFTENGVAMLSGVLHSPQAIRVNVAIMRIFTKLRSFHMLEKNLVNKIDELEKTTTKIFKVVFERLDDLETGLPALSVEREKIGLNRR